MTAREEILAKPAEVQTVLRAYMTLHLLDCDEATELQFALTGRLALQWWHELTAGMEHDRPDNVTPLTEVDIAKEIIERMRKQEVWGKILRGDAN